MRLTNKEIAKTLGVSVNHIKYGCCVNAPKESKLEARQAYIESFGLVVVEIDQEGVEMGPSTPQDIQKLQEDLRFLSSIGLNRRSLGSIDLIKACLRYWLIEKTPITDKDIASKLGVDPSLISYWRRTFIKKEIIFDGINCSYYSHTWDKKKTEATEGEWMRFWATIRAYEQQEEIDNAFDFHYYKQGFIMSRIKHVELNVFNKEILGGLI